VKFTVEIDDVLWVKIRASDALETDEQALTRILAVAITASAHVKSSTDLIMATGKVKVSKS